MKNYYLVFMILIFSSYAIASDSELDGNRIFVDGPQRNLMPILSILFIGEDEIRITFGSPHIAAIFENQVRQRSRDSTIQASVNENQVTVSGYSTFRDQINSLLASIELSLRACFEQRFGNLSAEPPAPRSRVFPTSGSAST